MSDRPAYGARFDDPDPDSFAAFLFTAVEQYEQDPEVELWMDPFPITDDMDDVSKAWCERVNPILEIVGEGFRETAIVTLQAAGVDLPRFGAPIPGLEKAVDQLVAGYRAGERLATSHLRDAPPYSAHLSRAARLIAGVFYSTNGPSDNARYGETARRLNRDIGSKSAKSLADDNIRRAVARYKKDMSSYVNRYVLRSGSPIDFDTYLRAEFMHQQGLVLGFTEVYRCVREQKIFPWLKGRELALAIHRKYDLPTRLDRALELLEQRGVQVARVA